MVVAYPPFFPSQILDDAGQPVANGRVLAYYAGSDVPAPLFSPDGTALGSSVTLNTAGEAVFCLRAGTAYKLTCLDAQGATVWTRDNVRVTTADSGMANPMEAEGDLIVGGPDGRPDRLAIGTDGDILATALYGGRMSPKWEAGPKKYRNVYNNIPSTQIDDGYLGRLFYLSVAGQALTLPATANIPSKSFIDFVFLNDAATLTITPDGTTTLNEQATAITIGGKSATLYRLTFLGHGPGGHDEWALGGSVLPDGKIKVGGSDTSPDYLAAKLSAGSGISLTNTGSAVEIAADAQTGDHKVMASSTDTTPDFLNTKITAGRNIAVTDNGSSLEIGSNEFWSIEGWSAGQANSVTFEAGYFYYSEIFPRVGSKFKRFVYLSGGNVTANGLTFAIYSQSRRLVTKSSTITVHSGNTSPSLIVELEDEVLTSNYAFGDTGLAHFYVGMLNDSNTGTNFVGQAIVPPSSSYRSGRFAATDLPTTFTLGGNTYFRFPRLVLNLY